MKVSFLTFSQDLASARYRQYIPIRELQKLGVEVTPEAETVVVSKHGWDRKILGRYKHVIYDICDDHFRDEHAEFYRDVAKRADFLTCNSPVMQWRIWEELRLPSAVIPDPYESEETEPSFGEGLLWFGHPSNLPDLWREVPNLKGYSMAVISNSQLEGVTPWSRKAVSDGLKKCGIVVIPTGKSPCKSANRMIEAIRAGKFVVANPLPAYEEFSPYAWIGDIRAGVDWAFANQSQALEMVKRGQKLVAAKFSPERIGMLWQKALWATSTNEST